MTRRMKCPFTAAMVLAASVWFGGASIAGPPDSPCPADITKDGNVGADDLDFLLLLWNHFGTDADINNDLIVNVFDLLELLAAWGPCPPP